MNYPEDLDLEGMSALDELTGDAVPFDDTFTPKLSCELEDLIQSTKRQTPAKAAAKQKSSRMDYLFKISAPITPTILASAAILPTQPHIHQGQGEDGDVLFCQVSDLDVPAIKERLAKTYPTVLPVFVPISKARKELSPFSAYPTLGYDTTLPHHRPQDNMRFEHLPTQDQYPVWYFFYGTLADSSVLARLFASPPGQVHTLVPAVIYGGTIKTWCGKYKALVDSLESRVEGWPYEVVSQEQEDALRMYETAKYEVVRVAIEIGGKEGEGRVVEGCTFRFAGEDQELD